MDRFYIEGPSRLHGRIAASGAKNAALPALVATLLADEPVVLHDVPRVRDIRTLLRVLEALGVSSEERSDGALVLSSGELGDEAPYELVKTMRASVLVLGPLLARRGHARVSLPGGCAIGVRPIDQHLAGLEALGARVELEHGYVVAEAQRLRGRRFRFATPTVGGTEHLMTTACLAEGTTVLSNCAREPEIVDLARLLTAMGARIEGAGTDTVTIEGVERLGGAEHRVIPDRIEIGTYLIAGAMTGGDVEVTGTGAEPAEQLGALLELLEQTGVELAVVTTGRRAPSASTTGIAGSEIAAPGGTPFAGNGGSVRVRAPHPLLAHDVVTGPHPAFPTDLQAQIMALLTQAEGTSRLRETVFENRFQHVPELVRMGARIQVEGRSAVVEGPTALSGARVMATDLRASACLVLAGLVAQGETVVDRIYHLDRGYEAMETKLQALGAKVRRRSEPMWS